MTRRQHYVNRGRRMRVTTSDAAEGVLLGLASGDALGRPVEFRSGDRIAAEYGTLTEMVGDGTWGQPAGTTTDDTALALRLARSLVDRGTFDPADVADRFVEWYDTDPFDVGRMTALAIRNLDRGVPWDEAGRDVWESQPEGQNAGNGSVMRCPPLAVPYADDPDRLVTVSRQSSRITHADPRCTWGCAVLNLTVARLLTGETDPLTGAIEAVRDDAPDELVAAVQAVADGTVEELRTTGYVIDTLQTGLHDGLAADDATEAIVTAVNRGGDTDTVGAVAGAVAGARFGAADLPDRWVEALDRRDELIAVARRL